MTPQQFLSKIQQRRAPAYLFIGPDTYWRDRCRAALLSTVLADDEREQGLARFDLTESTVAEVIDDARALSLFAPNRVILVSNAEGAVPKQRTAADDESEDATGPALLGGYLGDPSPGVVLVFDCARLDFEGDDKKKLDRVREFFSAVPDVVEMRHASPSDARSEAVALAKSAGLKFDREALELLIESLGADLARIAVEIEKLRLFGQTSVSADLVSSMVPDARATTIFALVNALGRKDRARALRILDTLTRDGEYLPLALSFLSTQFRMALIAREAGLRSTAQVQGHFSKIGIPMWGSRAEAVVDTATRFDRSQITRSLKLIFEADRDLRSARPDDRTIMEQFIFALTL